MFKQILEYSLQKGCGWMTRIIMFRSHKNDLFRLGYMIQMYRCLLLVSTATPSASSSFEFASLGAHQRFGVRVWHTRCWTEVPVGFASVTSALHQNCLATGWGGQSELIESQDLTSIFQDATTSLLSHTQSTNLKK